jgi:hypothetical protein
MTTATVTDLIQQLQALQKEIGCDGKGISSHPNSQSIVRFSITNPELDFDVELEDIELDLRMGCLCPEGVTFNLKLTGDAIV